MIPAHTPSDLVDGDTIKLGDYTSILIRINGHDESKLRRNPRRKLEDNGLEIKAIRRRGRPPKGEKVERRENMRVTRGRRNEVPENAEVLVVPENAGVENKEGTENMRVTRGRKNVVPENAGVENKEGRENMRVKRGRKNEVPGNAEVLVVPGKTEAECGGRENNEGKKTRGDAGGRRRRRDLKEEDKENVEGFREEGGEEAVASRGEVEEGLDLEKMTLGEWFDYVEVNLRKQVIEETEELIEGMRRKAERVKEYMKEKMKEKGKVPVG